MIAREAVHPDGTSLAGAAGRCGTMADAVAAPTAPSRSRLIATGAPVRRGAFSLVEMLVVVSIMVLLLSVALPAMNRIMAGTAVEGAASSVASAASTARAYASLAPTFPMGKYRGSAVVFTPANEMRIVRHTYDAVDGSGNYLALSSTNRAGYADVEDEPYVMMPGDVGVVGVARNGGAEAILLTPPFAVRFDQTGVLTPGQASGESRVVFYDADNDGLYVTTTNDRRFDGYDVDEWDPDQVGRTDENYFADFRDWGDGRYEEKYLLPFGRLDAVVGVIVYNKGALRRAGHDLVTDGTLGVNGTGDFDDPGAREWILANGTPVFFNRYSGAAIKP